MSAAKPVWPDSPWFTGANTPCRVEADVSDLEVVGTIPAEIDGAFYRVAADHQFPPRFAHDVPFNGDGMVSMFRIGDGRVHLKTRYVQTDRYKAEHEAAKSAAPTVQKNRRLRMADPERDAIAKSLEDLVAVRIVRIAEVVSRLATQIIEARVALRNTDLRLMANAESMLAGV